MDRFFEDGSLRLGSFAHFSTHKDEERRDTEEGRGCVGHMKTEGEGFAIGGIMRQGLNAYVLCGSTRYATQLRESFGVDSGFRINDTTAFANAISSHIPGFIWGCEGMCIYSGNDSIIRDMGDLNLNSFMSEGDDKNIQIEKVSSLLTSAAGDDLLFLKSDRFSHQNEYRMLWFCRQNIRGYIDIKCPEAREFCARLEPSEQVV